MKRIGVLISSLVLIGCLCAQMPQRLPEEDAAKHTEMICRELNIQDTVQRRKIYNMNLKYAYYQRQGNTRLDWLQRIEGITKELKTILTPEQYNRFMNAQINPEPRHPHHPYNDMPGPSSMPNMPSPPTLPQQ